MIGSGSSRLIRILVVAGSMLLALVAISPAQAEERGIDLTRACREQYSAPNASAVVGNSGDAFSWYCTTTKTTGPLVTDKRLGGIDIARACRSQYGRSWIVGFRSEIDPYSWYCDDKLPQNRCPRFMQWDTQHGFRWNVSVEFRATDLCEGRHVKRAYVRLINRCPVGSFDTGRVYTRYAVSPNDTRLYKVKKTKYDSLLPNCDTEPRFGYEFF